MNNDNKIKLVNENGVAKEYARIPDLWHTAQYLNELVQDHPGLAGASDEVLQVWHMAHDLKSVVEGQEQAKLIEPTMIGGLPNNVAGLAGNLSYVIELAGNRSEMWRQYADGVDILERLSEFYECDKDEAESIAHDTRKAVDAVRDWFRSVNDQSTPTPVVPELDLLAELERLETIACELIQDEQGAAEEAMGLEIVDFDGIVVPEDAAPELDDARGHIRDAIEILTALRDES